MSDTMELALAWQLLRQAVVCEELSEPQAEIAVKNATLIARVFMRLNPDAALMTSVDSTEKQQ